MYSLSTVTGYDSAYACIHNCVAFGVAYHLIYTGQGMCFEYNLSSKRDGGAIVQEGQHGECNAPCAPSKSRFLQEHSR